MLIQYVSMLNSLFRSRQTRSLVARNARQPLAAGNLFVVGSNPAIRLLNFFLSLIKVRARVRVRVNVRNSVYFHFFPFTAALVYYI